MFWGKSDWKLGKLEGKWHWKIRTQIGPRKPLFGFQRIKAACFNCLYLQSVKVNHLPNYHYVTELKRSKMYMYTNDWR